MVRELFGGTMRLDREKAWRELDARAKEAAARGEYFALRRLRALPSLEDVAVGLIGPFDIDDPGVTIFYIHTATPKRDGFVPCSGIDRFQAISLAVEMSRAHLLSLLKDYPEGFLTTTGEYYEFTDLMNTPAAAPMLDQERVRHYRSLHRKGEL